MPTSCQRHAVHVQSINHLLNIGEVKRMIEAEKRKEQKEALDNIRNGLATKVRILVAPDCCPVCKAFEGAYDFQEVPELPLEGCSRIGGCNAVYAPVLDRFGP